MRRTITWRRMWFCLGTIAAAAPLSACVHRGYYDAVYSDRHRWDSREDAAYRRWETERRIEHIEFERRNADEQRAYWNWRHAHPE